MTNENFCSVFLRGDQQIVPNLSFFFLLATLVSVHNPKTVLSRFKSEREKNTLIFKELLLIHLFISEYCFLTRDLKIENFLLDEHNNIKIVGECVLF